jgi:toxin ParE1/3/4
MFEYKVSINAKEDLRRIYAHGFNEYGEAQADSYYHGFFDIFDKIALNPFLYQSVDHIRPGYRRCSYCSDSIYYRVNRQIIEIMAILGGQDIDTWL